MNEAKDMFLANGMVCILGVTAMVGVILLVRKWEILLRFLTRSCMGIVCIYGINMVLAYMGITGLVGINWFTILCSGLLGIPGVGALYAVGALSMFS